MHSAFATPVEEPPVTRHRMAPWKRRLAMVSRWLHIYLSMASFGILFFFAVTGLTLNHTEWLKGQQRTVQYKGSVDVKWVRGSDEKSVAKLEIVELLRKAHGVRTAMSEFRIDEFQCTVSFKGPGYTADAIVDRATGKYEFTETRMGVVAILNDLHKGRDSGKVWSAIIDVSAVLMTLVALTGLVLIFYLQKRRMSGLISLAAGVALCCVIYRLWVP
ncbi:PepSY-associated TM helix domain-containing protein [Paludibaculum fermentans]|uniref:PepSY-associated TM helix domain-containing protein n=1 Tax=Paludibaculum fermentans TaxID=1473598 RepID=UPI003EBA5C2B